MQMININGKVFSNEENDISIKINEEWTKYEGIINGNKKHGTIENAVYEQEQLKEIFLTDSIDETIITLRINYHISKNDILSNSLYSLHCEENKYVLWEEINPLTN